MTLLFNSPSTLCNNHGIKYVSTSEKKKIDKLNKVITKKHFKIGMCTCSHLKTELNNFQYRSFKVEQEILYLFPLDHRSIHFHSMNQTLMAPGLQGNSTFGIQKCPVR